MDCNPTHDSETGYPECDFCDSCIDADETISNFPFPPEITQCPFCGAPFLEDFE